MKTTTVLSIVLVSIIALSPLALAQSSFDQPQKFESTPQAPQGVPQQGNVQHNQYNAQPPQNTASALTQPMANYMDFQKQPIQLRQYNPEKYTAYQITLKNTSPHHINVVQVKVPNAFNEDVLANKATQEKKKKSKRFGNMLRAASLGTSVAGSVTGMSGGYGASRALRHSSYAANRAARASDYATSDDGNVSVTGQYVNQLSNVAVSPQNQLTFQVVVPIGTQPTVSFVIKDIVTNQVFDLTK